ncbi:MAG: cysteine desulfurase NifS [Bacteroidia bacterium]|nr:MAG: cysteine desulfurase NifS [Bacteroidia bacterium]
MNNNQYPYFDNNATTEIDAQVLDVLNEYQKYYYANPSSTSHPSGMICNALYQQHKQKIADLLNVSENELIITSGATESINTAIKGIYFQYYKKKNHIISCKTEHSAVLKTLEYLQNFFGADVTLLDVNENGQINLDALERSIHENTLLVCLMLANNETGVIHPMEEIHKITQKHRVLFFCDTTQAFGKTKISKITADLFCGSAHKFYGPKGIGFLVIRNLSRKVFLHPLLHGGNQQEYRSGTIPLPLIAGLSKALELVFEQQDFIIQRIEILRNNFEEQLKQIVPVKIHSEKSLRICNTSNVQFPFEYKAVLLRLMKKFCFSRASACSDGSGKPSHVLTAMGLTKNEVDLSFRFSFSKYNEESEMNLFFEELVKSISEPNS